MKWLAFGLCWIAAVTVVPALLLAQDAITPSRYLSAWVINSVDGRAIADTGVDADPALLTLTPTSSYVEIACSDDDTCDITMGETGMTEGTLVTIVNLGPQVADFADTGGVSDIGSAFAAGATDSITLRYTGTTWVQVARSDN